MKYPVPLCVPCGYFLLLIRPQIYSCPDPCSRRIARRSIPNCSAFL